VGALKDNNLSSLRVPKAHREPKVRRVPKRMRIKPTGRRGAQAVPPEFRDPNAKPDGAQVGQLNAGETGGAQPEIGPKPSQVSIGDSAMQIKGRGPMHPVSSVQRLKPRPIPSKWKKKIGSAGGSGGTGSPGPAGGRNAAEKGRAMPAGL